MGRLGPFGALSPEFEALLSPQEEPLNVVHLIAVVAIGLCAAKAVGIGRTAFISFSLSGNSNVVLVTHENVGTLFNKGLGKTVFPANELEEYIPTGIPNEVLEAAIAKARIQYEAAKAEDTV